MHPISAAASFTVKRWLTLHCSFLSYLLYWCCGIF
nr:MAG TPA: hypothetical protein [Caudoviricetes sp.]